MTCIRRLRLVPIAVLGLIAAAEAGDDPAQAARARAMRELARAVSVQASGGAKIEVADEPSYRWDDPARRFGDGTVWVYGKSGRPAALLTLSLNNNATGGVEWLHELTSLFDRPFSARSTEGWTWSPPGPGIVLRPIPDAPAPADDEAKRLRQMRDQARRFKAFEFFDPTPDARAERYELRLLTRPIHQYKDPARGILDGGVFLIAYGQNPEIVLVVEARGEDRSAPRWSYGLGRISMAVLHVTIDDKELADWPDDARGFGANSPYNIFGRPARDLPPEK